jgi:hypothetical protein
MAPVLILPPALCLSPYGSALHEKPSNLIISSTAQLSSQQQNKMFRRSTPNLTTMKLNSEENIPLSGSANKQTATENKYKSSKTQFSPSSSNLRQRSIAWTRNNIITPALSSAHLRRTFSQQNDKPPNTFEEILNTTHRTEREVKASLAKLRRMILIEGLPEEVFKYIYFLTYKN